MRWRLRLPEYTFDMQYKPGASHHAPDFLSRTDNDAAVEDIKDDIPCLALAETANGLLTERYTGTDMPAPVEYDDGGVCEAGMPRLCGCSQSFGKATCLGMHSPLR